MVWDELAPICLHMGTLTMADVVPFTTLCELQAKVRVAAQLEDPVPLLRLAGQIRAYYGLFGLEPVSRARIHVKKPSEPASKWAGKLAGSA